MSSPVTVLSAAAIAIALLLAATHVALDTTHTLAKQTNLNQFNAQLDLADQLIENWQQEHLNNVAGLSRLSWVQNWTAQQLLAPQGVPERSPHYYQLRELYRQQGYHGHVLFDGTPKLVDDANNAARQVFSLPPETLEVLRQSALQGAAISHPFPAPVHLHFADQPPGTLMYLVCARLQPELSEGNLCLHFDQQQGLAALLNKVGHNHTGQLYALEAGGRSFGATPNVDVAHIQAGYQEHPKQQFVSFTRWSPALELNLVLEVPFSTLYAPYHLSRLLIVGLSALGCLLIVGLSALALRSRKLLANREVLYRQILDQLPLEVRVQDLAGQIHLENRLAFNNTQRAHPTPLNAMGFPSAGLSQRLVYLLQRVKASATLAHQDIVQGKPGEERFYAARLVGFPIFDAQQRLFALGSLAIDQSSSVQSQHDLQQLALKLEEQVQERTAELAEARDAAEAAARAKADFLANMSHEIRSPLSAVLGLAHLAERSNQSPQVAAYLQRIITAAGHLQEMLNDILDFSKFEAGKLKLEHIAFSPERLLEGVADIVWDKAQRKNLSVLFDLDPQLPEQLYGDPLRLSQILINLTDNALKFTSEGMVAIRVRALGQQGPLWQVCFEVQDSGIGIPQSDIENIFRPFEQLDQSIARRHGGTGLGLAICRQLAKLMSATFEARSQPGLGSLFSLTVSLTQVTEQPESLVLPIASQQALIVDAKTPTRTSLAAKLSALGLYVTEAASAEEAFALLEQRLPPVHWLFIDWDLPDMASHDFAARVRRQKLAPYGLCVLLSGRGTGRLLPAEVLEHFAAVLDKPVSPLKLRETLMHLAKPALPNFHGRHVLLVEDEPLNQEVACELLKALALEVSVAENGAQALELLANDQSIELVLLDMQMPVLDGLATFAKLKHSHPQLPVIAMTGNCLPGDRERYLATGMHDYLAKPFKPEALATLLNRWLAHQSPTQQLNTEQALERLLGNQALYEKLLRRFKSDYHDFAQTLHACLYAEDHLKAAELLHSFKSLVATIGADNLRDIATQLETDLHRGQCVARLTQRLAQDLAALLQEIEQRLALKEVHP